MSAVPTTPFPFRLGIALRSGLWLSLLAATGLSQAATRTPTRSTQVQGGQTIYSGLNTNITFQLPNCRIQMDVARRFPLGLAANVAVVLDEKGHVTTMSLAESSGDDEFDSEVLATTNRCSEEFPPLPDLLKGSTGVSLILHYEVTTPRP